jgi:hypothetical protein
MTGTRKSLEERMKWKQENIKRLEKERAEKKETLESDAIRREVGRIEKLAEAEATLDVDKIIELREQHLLETANIFDRLTIIRFYAKEIKKIQEEKKKQGDLPMTIKPDVEKIQEKVTSVAQEIIPESLAKVFYASGIFKDIKSEAQAVVKILAGREMGLTPIQSMTNVYVLENKVGYETKVFLSKVKKSGKYDYSYKFIDGKDGKLESCEVTFYSKENGERVLIGSSSFSVYDAAKLGLINKSNYKNYLDLMLFYRAAIKGIKMCCPDILDGAAVHEEYQEILPAAKEEVAEEISLEGLDNE